MSDTTPIPATQSQSGSRFLDHRRHGQPRRRCFESLQSNVRVDLSSVNDVSFGTSQGPSLDQPVMRGAVE